MRMRRRRTGTELPPLRLTHRDVASEAIPEGGGTEVFDTDAAVAINEARMTHLDSLGLPLARRRVLDVGGGVGHLAQYFVARDCEVVSTDAREENVARMRELYPQLIARRLDVEVDEVSELGEFDVVFCYGLLYHLENPLLALRHLVKATREILLIETMVCDAPIPVLRLDDETLSLNQALRGLAHRPSPSYVALALDRMGMPFVYRPLHPPGHADYRYAEQNDFAVVRDGHLLRAIFVASRTALNVSTLRPLIDKGS